MSDQGNNRQQIFQMLRTDCEVEFTPCYSLIDFENDSRYTKLNISAAQKMQVSALLQQLPSAMAADTMSHAYCLTFPDGMPHTLMKLKQGGFSSVFLENGKITGHGSLYSLAAQATLLNVFTAMSIASGQYFLAEINSELKVISSKLEKILEFLYGDKKAELISEIKFVRYAHQNYSSIMTHEEQRVATIISLQEAKKIALKDIEFYLRDLEAAVNAKDSELPVQVEKALQIRECLMLSMQLYVLGNLLEVYYSQNFDASYIKYVEDEVSVYIEKCEKHMLSCFSMLKQSIVGYKVIPLKKFDKTIHLEKVDALIESLNGGEESALRKSLHSSMQTVTQKAEYYAVDDGVVYLKTS